jgi:Na+/H+ antiporter NhaD/arsenite permease-like protein
MGALTYIGNGPNFLVRTIAVKDGVRMPSFFGYLLKWSVPFMIPPLVAMCWLFLH